MYNTVLFEGCYQFLLYFRLIFAKTEEQHYLNGKLKYVKVLSDIARQISSTFFMKHKEWKEWTIKIGILHIFLA